MCGPKDTPRYDDQPVWYQEIVDAAKRLRSVFLTMVEIILGRKEADDREQELGRRQ